VDSNLDLKLAGAPGWPEEYERKGSQTEGEKIKERGLLESTGIYREIATSGLDSTGAFGLFGWIYSRLEASFAVLDTWLL
jgi:hypothetical protein